MEQQDQLKNYIYKQLQSGISPDEITSQLRGAGWDENTISDAFKAVQAQIVPSGSPESLPGVSRVAGVQQPAQFNATGKKRGRIKTAWLLMKQSLKVLKTNRELLRYPFMGVIFSLLLVMIFALIGFLGGDTFYYMQKDVFGDEEVYLTGPGMALAFVYYVLAFFAVFMYNTGLSAHVLDLFRGKTNDYKHYMGIAWSKKTTIFIYSLISATVGVILRSIEQRAQWLGWIVSRFFGVLWALANLFTIPVIAETDSNAPSAIKQSSKLFISKWGENIAARIGFGGLMLLLYLLVLIPFMFVTGLLFFSLGLIGFIIWGILLLFSILLFVTIESAASQVLSTALYFYAKYEQIPATFDVELLNSALIPKKARRGLFGKKKAPEHK